MFEEAQLYSPVTQAEDGSVTVHLSDDHPGKADPEYQTRRNEIAAAALGWRRGGPIRASAGGVWGGVCLGGSRPTSWVGRAYHPRRV